VNVMTMPNLPTFEILKKCWVKRVSMGPFVYNYLNDKFRNVLNSIEKDQSFNSLFK
jgi:2-methylisocitrate lyase-like PEP mutase family enzyme